MEGINDQLTGSVFFYGIMLSGSLTSLPATQQGDASCNGVMPLLTAGFFGYLPSIFSGLYAQVFYGKRIEHSKQFTAYRNYRLDFLQWIILLCGVITVKKLKFSVFLQVEVLLPETGLL